MIAEKRLEALDYRFDFDQVHDARILELRAPRQCRRRLAAKLGRSGIVTVDAPAPVGIRSRAQRIARRVQAEHLRADRIGHVHRAGVGRDHEGRPPCQREKLLERVLADQIERRLCTLCHNGVAEFALVAAWAAAQDRAAAARGDVVDHRGVALRSPIARWMTRTRAYQERGWASGNVTRGEFLRLGWNRYIPANVGLPQSQWFDEAADRVEYVLAAARGNAAVDEQAVQILRARGIVAYAQR